VADVLVVEIGDRREDLSHYDGGLGFGETLFLNDEIEELSTLAYLGNEVDGFLRLVYLVKLNDIRVVKFF
jgi:hypothetical protein